MKKTAGVKAVKGWAVVTKRRKIVTTSGVPLYVICKTPWGAENYRAEDERVIPVLITPIMGGETAEESK